MHSLVQIWIESSLYQCYYRDILVVDGGISMNISSTEYLFLAFLLSSSLFWVWMFLDALIAEEEPRFGRKIWLFVIALTHIIGAAFYFFLHRRRIFYHLADLVRSNR